MNNILEGLIYDEGGLPGKPSQVSPISSKAPATKYWKEHLQNHYILSHFHQHGTTQEKIQAAKELPIAERKMKFWSSHENFNPEDAQQHHDSLKKHWGGSKELRDFAVQHVRSGLKSPGMNVPITTAKPTEHPDLAIDRALDKTPKKEPEPSLHNVVARPKQANSRPMSPAVQKLLAMRASAPNSVQGVQKANKEKVVAQTSVKNSKEVEDFLSKGGKIQKVAKGKSNYRWPQGNPERKPKKGIGEEMELVNEIGDTKLGQKKLKAVKKRALGKVDLLASIARDDSKEAELYKNVLPYKSKELKNRSNNYKNTIKKNLSVLGNAAARIRENTQLDEISKKTLKSYVKKAGYAVDTHYDLKNNKEAEFTDAEKRKIDKHQDGIVNANAKMKKNNQRAKVYATEDMKDVNAAKPLGAKPLSQIISKPSRKYNEYTGSTDDERKIVKMYRDHTVLIPDANGNGDDVFKAAKIKRAEKPINPGDDEKKYAEWNGDVAFVENTSDKD